MKPYINFLIMLIITTSGQIFVKLASRKLEKIKLSYLITNQYLYMAFLMILAGPVIVNLTLDYFDLSVVFAFTGLYYIFVPLSANYFLKEKISLKMFVGMFSIMIGVMLYFV